MSVVFDLRTVTLKNMCMCKSNLRELRARERGKFSIIALQLCTYIILCVPEYVSSYFHVIKRVII